MEKKWNMGRLKGLAKTAGAAAATLAVSFCSALPAHAAGVNDSQIVKGTERLIGDVTTWLMVLAPVVAENGPKILGALAAVLLVAYIGYVFRGG